MRIKDKDVSTVRELAAALELSGAALGREIELGQYQITRRLRDEAKWTADEMLRLHVYLKYRRVRHTFKELVELCRGPS